MSCLDVLIKYYHLSLYPRLRVPVPPSCVHCDINDICASLKYERMIDYSYQLFLILYPPRCRETISLRGPVFHRSHGHNLVRPGRQSEVNYGYVSKICR